MYCDNCKGKGCYDCLSDDEQNIMYDIVMDKPVYDRIKYGCDCYMCNTPYAANCYEVSLYYNLKGKYKKIAEEVEKIKKQIRIDDNWRKLKTNFMCFVVFKKLFDHVKNERYKPGNKGYIEAKMRFEDQNTSSEYFQYK